MKTEELVAALRKCGSSVGVWCFDALMLAAADRLEEYVDRCKRYADEIMELRERGRWIPVEERLPLPPAPEEETE